MKILLHTCCGPCSVYPVPLLREAGHFVAGYFYRDNIHPFTECEKREHTLLAWAESIGLTVIVPKGYGLEDFLRELVFREADRCGICYFKRISATAALAKKSGFDAFSTTLLYSKFQNHELIRKTGESVAASYGTSFYYQDFREGWKQGIQESKRLGMYRQGYCGCIYSEKDRYFNPNKKKTAKAAGS